jgi:hypothetical protein
VINPISCSSLPTIFNLASFKLRLTRPPIRAKRGRLRATLAQILEPGID